MIDTDKYEGHLADALVVVREGGVDCDFSKIRIEDALGDMADLLAEVKRLREEVKVLSKYRDVVIQFDENIQRLEIALFAEEGD